MAKRKTLAVKPGKRLIGVAYVEDGKLLYYGVKTMSPRIREMRNIMLRLLRDLKPRTLAVEKTYYPNGGSAFLNRIAPEIKAIGKRKGVAVVRFAPNTVRRFICGNGHGGKMDVARAMARRYPELKALLYQNRRWKEKRNQRVFDAVALALLAEAER